MEEKSTEWKFTSKIFSSIFILTKCYWFCNGKFPREKKVPAKDGHLLKVRNIRHF